MKNINRQNAFIQRLHIRKISALTDFNLPARSSVLFTAINIFSKGAAFVFTPIFTRLLTEAEYGEYSLFNTILSVTVVLGSLELSGGVIMRAHQKERSTESLTTLIAMTLSWTVTVAVFCGFLAIKRVTGGGMSFPFSNTLLLLATLGTNTVNLFLSGARFRYKWLPSLLSSVASSVIAPILGIAFIRAGATDGYRITAKLFASVMITVMLSFVFIFITVKRAKAEISKELFTFDSVLNAIKQKIRLLLRLSLPLLPYYISIALISSIDKITVGEAFGKEALALYSVAYSAGIALSSVFSGVSHALCPWIMRKTRAGKQDAVRQTLGNIFLLFAGVCAAFMLLSPEVLSLLAPSSYNEALPVLLITAISPIPICAAACSSSIAIAEEKVGGVLLAGVIPLSLSLLYLTLAASRLGILFAAISVPAAYTLSALIECAGARRITGSRPFSPWLLSGIALALALFGAIVFRLKNLFPLRLVILGSIILFILYMLYRLLPLILEKRTSATADNQSEN